jgi:hypothetical protein
MKWYAKYIFKDTFYHKPRLIPYVHIGVDIPDFPPEWIEPTWEYPRKRMPDSYYKNPPKYKMVNLHTPYPSPSFSLEFIPEMPNFMFGRFKNDAVLVKIERTRYEILKIIIWFFRDMGQQSEMLYEQWISCQLDLDYETGWLF